MPFCTSCGTRNEDTTTSCATCGVPIHQTAAAVPPAPDPVVAAPLPVPPPPVQAYSPPPPPLPQPTDNSNTPPPPGSRYAVLGSASIWFSIFWMHIPVVGWITCLVWAFSRKGNLNRRNLARATLVFIIFEVISWWCAYYLIGMAVNAMMGAVQTAANTVSGSVLEEFAGIGESLEGLLLFFESLPF